MRSGAPRDPVRADVEAWFTTLERCVGAVDYETARDIFAPNVVAFGTRADVVSGLDQLQANQWSGVWPTIRDFRFDLTQLHWGWAGDQGWAVITWSSTGFHQNGDAFSRPGRATVILIQGDRRLRAIHTHFSLAPGLPSRSFGPPKPA